MDSRHPGFHDHSRLLMAGGGHWPHCILSNLGARALRVYGFFSGIGGFELGFERAGFTIVSLCEIDSFCLKVLAKHFPKAQMLGDIRSLSGDSLAQICPLLASKRASLAKTQSSGTNTSDSSKTPGPLGSSQKMSATHGAGGCPNCGATSTPSGTPACQFECKPQTLGRRTDARASSLLPTPTAKPYGNCRGGRNMQDTTPRPSLSSLGIMHPEDWERMMGFPIGWTDVGASGTRSSRSAQKSSQEESGA